MAPMGLHWYNHCMLGFCRVVQRERNGARERKVSQGKTTLYSGGAGEKSCRRKDLK
jgi:hypothetical protein